jgi:site-specific DNA-methyltransferase (adenine-specific)/modification methylase
MIHDHQKPVELLKFLIEKSSNEGEVLFEPFAGSGSLYQAAKELNISHTSINKCCKNKQKKAGRFIFKFV